MEYFLPFTRVVTFFSLLAALKETCLPAHSCWLYWKKCCKGINKYFLLTKYFDSLNNPLRANGDFLEQIFARKCNYFEETEQVITSGLEQEEQLNEPLL